jgi:arylsulfatase A-like enzyme/Tfp pilus assembly protein PilF
MRRNLWGQFALVGLLIWACGSPTPESPEREDADRPGPVTTAEVSPGDASPSVDNILLITIDTLRWDALGFSGNSRSRTPHLDRLAASGLEFRHAHAHNVVTLPSHANILTGLYPYQNGIRDNKGFVLPESIPTAATLLSTAGFRTGAFVGAFPLDSRFGLDRGFEVYDDEVPEGSRPTEMVPAERRGDEVVSLATEWWQSHEGERRFLWVHLYDPHAPYQPAEPFASEFSDNPYLGEVAAVDTYLWPLLERHLQGGEASTLIVVTSDHGEALGDHGESTHGLFAYEATLKVPLIVWHPGIEPSSSQRPAGHVDILPTLLAAAGVDVPAGLPGESLLRPGPAPAGQVTYFEALTPTLERGWAPLRGVLSDGRKYISTPVPELYDLRSDPGESRNLFTEQRQQAGELARELPEESVWPPEQDDVDPETAAALQSLGYLGGRAPAKQRYTEADDPKNLVHLDTKMHQVVDLYHQGRLDEAETVVREVLEERPDMGLAYYFWAQVKLEQGRLPEAIMVMNRARDLGVATPALLRQLGLSLAAVGEAGEAVPLLQPLAETGDVDALNALGLILSEGGDQVQARRVLERVFDTDSRNPVTHQHLSLVALRETDWARARDEANKALELNRDLPLAWNYLGTAQYNLGSPRQALDAWDQALALEPDNLDVLYNMAVVATEFGDRDRARRALQTFITLAPSDQYGPDIQRAKDLLRQLGS